MKRLGFLREAAWLNGDRTYAYATIMTVLTVLTLLLAWTTLVIGHVPFQPALNAGKPGGSDFLAFWSAGHLAVLGAAGAPYYNDAALAAQELRAAYLKPGEMLAFFYPPVAVMLCMPFGALPYLAGYAAFMLSQTALMLAALRRLLPPGWGWRVLICFPAFLANAGVGQNGFFPAAAFGAAALWLDRAPVAAGVALGFLVFKPHLALAVPVALLCARRFTALVACGGTALALMAASAAVLGPAAWPAFLLATKTTFLVLDQHHEDWVRLLGVHTMVRELGLGLHAAYIAQSLTIVATLAVLARLALLRPDGRLLAALTVSATLLLPPHLLDYDLAMAAVPMLVLAGLGCEHGWLGWEKAALAAMWLLPLLGRLATDAGIPIGPPLLLGLFAATAHRVWRHYGPAPAAGDRHG